jgi:hypothetical protein
VPASITKLSSSVVAVSICIEGAIEIIKQRTHRHMNFDDFLNSNLNSNIEIPLPEKTFNPIVKIPYF